MDFKPWMENISIEDLPNDDLKFVAQCAGIKVALTLIFCLPGLIVNIPKHALKKLKERYILKEYDGTKMTLNRLVVECELSQRHEEAVIRKDLKKSKKPPKCSP